MNLQAAMKRPLVLQMKVPLTGRLRVCRPRRWELKTVVLKKKFR